MKVLQVLHQLSPNRRGGLQTHVRQLCRQLRARDWEVEILSGHEECSHGGESPRSDMDGFSVTTFKRPMQPPGLGRFMSTFHNPWINSQFAGLLRASRPDVIHLHHLDYLSHGLLDQATALGIPSVMTLHDHGLLCHRLFLVRPDGSPCDGPGAGWRCGPCNLGQNLTGLAAGFPFWLKARSAHRLLTLVDLFLSPTDYLARFHCRLGLRKDRVRVLPLGVPLPGKVRTAAGGDRVRFGFAGTLRPHKGAHLAIQAFARLPEGSAELVVHGDPSLDLEYGRQIADAAARSGATVLPPFDDSHRDAVLTALDCVLIPSLAAENAPVLLRECLIRRVPVLASRIGGAAEAAREGEGVEYFTPGDVAELASKMRQFVESPVTLERLASRAPEFSGPEDHAKGIESAYREVLARHGT